MATVTLKNVSKIYESSVAAVDDVSLDVKDGEFLVLVGPSGCGKSTTLRIVAGLETPTDGKVYIDGRLVNDVLPRDRDIAMVFQNYALYPHMTAYENMAFGLKLRGVSKEAIDGRVREAADILNIEQLLSRKPRELSGGQRQRVAVGRAIVRKPKVFLFDEPLSNLDLKLRVQMRAEFSKIHDRLKATMIYVTHDQAEAMTMGDRIAAMRDGGIRQLADPDTLYRNPADLFVAQFIGMPPMNIIDGEIIEKDSVISFRGDFCGVEVPPDKREALKLFVGKRVAMGIRPEDVHVSADGGVAKAVVDVVQPLGPQKFLYLKLGGRDYTARVPAETQARVGDTINISFDTDRIHFFDLSNGKAII